jgi:hypothetical protein
MNRVSNEEEMGILGQIIIQVTAKTEAADGPENI